jgi:hypothetical protein
MKTYTGIVKWFEGKPKEQKKEDKPNGCGFIFLSLDTIEQVDEEFIRDILIPGKTRARVDYSEKIAEIFVHISGVADVIKKGDEVQFNLTKGHGAPKAVNVKRI